MAKLISESLDDFFLTNPIDKLVSKVYDKLEKLNSVIGSFSKKISKKVFTNFDDHIRAQQEFFKLIKFIGLEDNASINDIKKLDKNSLFILNNGLNLIMNDYNIEDLKKSKKDFVSEAYEPKDLKRIKDFSKKSDGNFEKEVALARQMANTLTNMDKAIGRAEAAAEVYGGWNEIVEIFYDKAKQLGYKGPKPGERLNAGILLGSKLPKEQQYKNKFTDNRRYIHNESFILPLGSVDLRSGECKFFNIYNTWGDHDTTVEVWVEMKNGVNYKSLDTSNINVEDEGGIAGLLKPKPKEEIDLLKRKYFNYKIIFTSGNTPNHEIGDKVKFRHDQSQKLIGYWEMVDYVSLKYMSELILPYGNKIFGYTYK